MNMNDFKRSLEYIGVEQEEIAFGGIGDDMWCIVPSNSETREVFYYDRGHKNKLARFPTEDAACTYLFGRLAYSKVLTDQLVLARG